MPLFVIVIVTFGIAHSFMSIISMGVTTVFLCFCKDLTEKTFVFGFKLVSC